MSKKKTKKKSGTRSSKHAPWGYRKDGKPKRKPGRRKGQRNRKKKGKR